MTPSRRNHRRDCTSRSLPARFYANKKLSKYPRVCQCGGSGCAGLLLLLLAGCAGPSLSPGDWSSRRDVLAGGAERQISADWDDVDAAVMLGASKSEMAVVTANPGPPRAGGPGGAETTQRIFELKTVRDEPAWLMVTRDDASPTGELEMQAKIGRFGDPEREREFLGRVADRLEQLRGREVAPIR